MRIQLWLRPKQHPTRIPLNYSYALSSAIYKILERASPQYAAFLHDRGYPAPSGKLMKLFTFSKLWIPAVRLQGDMLEGSSDRWRLQIGSPMLDEFVRNFVLGLFETTAITLATRDVRAEFLVEEVAMLLEPAFGETIRCKCLSPLAVSTGQERDGRIVPHYYRPDEPGLSEALRHNLLEKHQIVYGRPPADDRLVFALDPTAKPKSKLIAIKEGTPEETFIKAFETYFTLTGSTELMQVAWECGMGERTSQGFGMVEVMSF